MDTGSVSRARNAYAALIQWIQAGGYRVDTYQFPFIADERKVHSHLYRHGGRRWRAAMSSWCGTRDGAVPGFQYREEAEKFLAEFWRPPFPSLPSPFRGIASELDQARLLRM